MVNVKKRPCNDGDSSSGLESQRGLLEAVTLQMKSASCVAGKLAMR